MLLYNHPSRKELRQELRNARVPAEVKRSTALRPWLRLFRLSERETPHRKPFLVDHSSPGAHLGLSGAWVKIWAVLRRKQFHGLKFRRQCGIGQYVVDFYCPEIRLVIEVDGDSHFLHNTSIADTGRQKFIEGQNIRVIRFSNDDVHNNLDGVLEQLNKLVL